MVESDSELFPPEPAPLMKRPSRPARPARRERGCIVDLIFRFFYFFFELVVVLFFSALIFTLAAGGSYLLVQRHIRGQEVLVPNVAGKSVAEAAKSLLDTKTDLSLKIEAFEPSDLVEEGEIISQNPQPDNRVKAGTVISLRVSQGSKLVPCPDVSGKNFLEAGIALRDANLQEGAKTFIASPDVKKDLVMGQDPPPHALVERQARVNLLVSAGPHASKSLMPKIQDLKPQDANEKLAPLGLSIGDQTEGPAPGKENGIIIEQSPSVGAPVSPGDLVRVKVCKNE